MRGEDAVEAFEGERAFAVEEIRDVGLLEAGLLGEPRTSEGAAFDAAKEFKAKEFVKVLKVHRVAFLWRTISFDKAKIKRIILFVQ